ncbi:transcription factor sox-15 [Lasius niger]|uniref:Transcription factor sox-15 n=1 Tax=Lasius niger TaxID=67767 RepID=A0A0J7KMK4_LASNI|nr:transcription factor sox-15 [Lasius niger]
MPHHQEYQTDTGSAQQHAILGGHIDPGMSAEEDHQQQLEKYFKYSHPTSVAHSSLSSQSMLDSNHNYASDLRYYGAPSQLDISNSQCIVDDQQSSKDARCSNVAIGHTMEQYHQQNLEVSKYPDHSASQQQHQQPQSQQQQQPQNMEHVSKADDDFSVILADVRKTCYSS